MKIEDCKTLTEFFGVHQGGLVWIEGEPFNAYERYLSGEGNSDRDGQALVGCLTGQLKWSKHEPVPEDEERMLRRIAAWNDNWGVFGLTNSGTIYVIYKVDKYYADTPFNNKDDGSKAYEVLTPILEKYGEINLDDYR